MHFKAREPEALGDEQCTKSTVTGRQQRRGLNHCLLTLKLTCFPLHWLFLPPCIVTLRHCEPLDTLSLRCVITEKYSDFQLCWAVLGVVSGNASRQKETGFSSWELNKQSQIWFPQIHWKPDAFLQNQVMNEIQATDDYFLIGKEQRHLPSLRTRSIQKYQNQATLQWPPDPSYKPPTGQWLQLD